MRWSSQDFAGRLREAFSDVHLPGVDGPPNFSILVGEASGTVTTKHTLYRANARVMTTISEARLLRALIRGLAAYEVGPAPDGHIHLIGAALLADGTVTLVDPRLSPSLGAVAPRLTRVGVRVIDTSVISVDLDDMIVDFGPTEAWATRLARIDDTGSRRDRFEGEVPEGPWPLTGIVSPGRSAPDPLPAAGPVLALLNAREPPSGAAVQTLAARSADLDLTVTGGDLDRILDAFPSR